MVPTVPSGFLDKRDKTVHGKSRKFLSMWDMGKLTGQETGFIGDDRRELQVQNFSVGAFSSIPTR